MVTDLSRACGLAVIGTDPRRRQAPSSAYKPRPLSLQDHRRLPPQASAEPRKPGPASVVGGSTWEELRCSRASGLLFSPDLAISPYRGWRATSSLFPSPLAGPPMLSARRRLGHGHPRRFPSTAAAPLERWHAEGPTAHSAYVSKQQSHACVLIQSDRTVNVPPSQRPQSGPDSGLFRVAIFKH